MKRVYALLGVLFLLMALGCGPQAPKSKSAEGKVLYSITDVKGNVVTFDKAPEKVLAVSRGLNDIVVDLLEPEKIVAVTEETVSSDSIVAEKAKKVKQVIARNPSAEIMMKLKPDLIIMPMNTDLTKLEALRAVGIKVVLTTAPHRLVDMRERVAFVAKVLHKEEAGKVMLAKMDAKLQALEEAKSKFGTKKRILLAFSNNGAYGRKGGLFDDLCDIAGIINGAGNAGLKRLDHLSKEQVISINPDMILLPSNAPKGKKNNLGEEVLSDPAYAGLNAVKNRRVISMDEKFYKYNVSHYAADAAYMLGKAVYPEYVKDVKVLDY